MQRQRCGWAGHGLGVIASEQKGKDGDEESMKGHASTSWLGSDLL